MTKAVTRPGSDGQAQKNRELSLLAVLLAAMASRQGRPNDTKAQAHD
jgi:hypothetical protein